MNRLFFTLSAFFNQHDDLLSTEVSAPFSENASDGARVILPLRWANNLHGSSHGVEVTGDYRPLDWWRWTASYSGLRIQLTRDEGTQDLTQERTGEGNSPRHQVQVQSSMDLGDKWDFDWIFRYVSQLPNLRIPGYANSDLRLAWRPSFNVELSVVGRNLHDPQHPEFAGGSEIQRSVYAQLVWRWQ
jgi:iron complex outermembrane receptor protein